MKWFYEKGSEALRPEEIILAYDRLDDAYITADQVFEVREPRDLKSGKRNK